MNARDETGFVRIRKIHLLDRDRPFPGRSAFGFLEDEPGAVIDLNLFRIARDRILDRLERDSKVVAKASGALQTVEVKFERNKARFEQGAESSGENFERKSADRAGTDLEQGVALFRRSFLVDEKADGAVPFVNRLRPFRSKAETSAVERNAIELAALDPPDLFHDRNQW
jgi:hypothetical protein